MNKAPAASSHHLQHKWSCTVYHLLTILTPSRAPLAGWLLSGTPSQCAGWLESACYWPTYREREREQKIPSSHNWNQFFAGSNVKCYFLFIGYRSLGALAADGTTMHTKQRAHFLRDDTYILLDGWEGNMTGYWTAQACILIPLPVEESTISQ